MQTTIKYRKPNGGMGTSYTTKQGKQLAFILRSIESKGNTLMEVRIPLVGTLLGTQIYEYIMKQTKRKG